ncbi:MAG TPA: arginine deiminase family protein [Allosphingosinicella sp.]|jgi:N-dimethylarginine dimethylaminohydrolase|uniref:dimethylarginine dimethylaminohydrolase family protein n=1 Tax=Allosphingosinicella sp. TaxID=2823234 RepID=UPI002F280423
MLFEFASSGSPLGDALVERRGPGRWSVDSEYGILRDVMLSGPHHLEMVPCNAVTRASLDQGLTCSPDLAALQHEELVRSLQRAGVRCHQVPSLPQYPDLCFTRDSSFMTPWGLILLRLAPAHRRGESAQVRAAAESWGVPIVGEIEQGTVEGGDVCLLRPGLVAIGWSGDRTCRVGAEALAAIFERRGWRALLTRFDPKFLHLDTLFTLIDRDRAVACVEALEDGFLATLADLDIAIVPASSREVDTLGPNLLALGQGRVLSASDNVRINGELERLGCEVITVDIGQFTRCGGGVHCLTMPLARLPS